MKRNFLVVLLLMVLFSACAAPGAAGPTPVSLPSETEVVLPTPDAPTEAAAEPKLPAPPFEAETYVDEQAGFAFDYPLGWTVSDAMSGGRGTQVQFLSSPEIADAATLPAGATRLFASLYDWDPKNDLPAYIATRKTAWESSGFTVVEEQQLTLEQGLPAVQFTVQTPEVTTVFLIAALRDRYLVLSGEGDLELVKQIVQRLRPIA